jgi:Tol biopolymer transport system component/predicted Ser/Thr protein kinase
MVDRTIGQYRIREMLGEGGMGIVYKALDTHLDRFVALKLLPPEKVSDSDRKDRFVQEAKAASALNHPNIIHIYDIDRQNGVDFIAMEYVDGKTLDQLIPRHGMRLNEVLKYSVQIADALASAHEAGIVHRDLKPGNVMVTDKGQVKVLDFGLAKLTNATALGDDVPTRTMKPVTEEGKIVGTVAYMSPEQAQGKKLDARSDIFSFGSVLYEMVTGKRAFEVDSSISTLGAIIHKEPEPLGSKVPHELKKVISRCLRKEPERRFQHMDDVKVVLEELKQESDSGTLETRETAKPRASRRLPWAASVAGALLMAIAGIWFVRSRTRTPEAQLAPVPLTSYPGTESYPSFSPDGTQVAFAWCREQGKSCDIYVKQVGVEAPYRLTDKPAFEYNPAWSPDGRTIAFLRWLSPTSGALVVIPQRGGRERVLAELDVPIAHERIYPPYLAWTPDSRWLIWPVFESNQKRWALYLVSVETGQQRRLTSPPADAIGDTAPAISPDGRTLAFARASALEVRQNVYLLRLGEGYTPLGDPQKLRSEIKWSEGLAWTPDGTEIVLASGPWGESGLWRMRTSESGTPRRLAFASENAFAPAVSRQGSRMAYVTARYDANIWSVELSKPGGRGGVPSKFISSTRPEHSPAYSPDGKRIAFVSDRSGTAEIWICDRGGSNPVQLTSLGADMVRVPRWAPNGESIAFEADPGGNQDVYTVNANGGVPRRLTADQGADEWPDWSRDNQSVYFVSGRGGTKEIWKIPVSGGNAVQVTRNANADIPQASPDGSFLYYSKGSPHPMTVWRVSADGGEGTKILDGVLRWTVAKDGIYFFNWPDDKGHKDLSVYEFTTGKVRKILTIERPVYGPPAVSPNGGTILYTQDEEAGEDIMLVENFH